MEIWGGSHAADSSVSTPGLDISVYSRPYAQAHDGGDIHYVSVCGGGIITRFILADVSGHGAKAADVAHSLRDLMRRNINRKSQARLVKELNRQFAALTDQQRFATAVVGTYLATSDRLSLCNAGHPRPFWYRAASRQWSVLTGADEQPPSGVANLPLGIDDGSAYPQGVLNLKPGDLVLVYTDAFIEAADPGGRHLGETGLLDLVRRLNPDEPLTIAPRLTEALDQYRTYKPADDDLTLLLVHHNAGPPTRLSLRQKLDVYAKVFGLRRV
jgi:serine phosphatase RsbU (regulator of sigma subunit)